MKTSNPTVLIADGAPHTLRLIQRALEGRFHVITAQNGWEAVEKFKNESPDLVLMDMEMPEMTGIEACQRIKQLAGSRFIPVIFVTGRDDAKSLKAGLESGAEDYMIKPFRIEELVLRLEAALRTKTLYDRLMFANSLIEKERDTIAKIQQSLLTRDPPETPGLSFFCDYQPSSKAGGDYYDFIQIDDEHLGLWMSDVSGHGTPAAVIMAMERIVLHTHLAKVRSPAEALTGLNQILCDNIRTGDFITAFYGVLHLPTGVMRFASAGHPPPLLADYAGEGKLTSLAVDRGFPLMISPHNPFEERSVQLQRGNKLVLYTDGITEACNNEKEMYGRELLEQLVLFRGKDLDARGLAKQLRQSVKTFCEGAALLDDYTLMVMEIL